MRFSHISMIATLGSVVMAQPVAQPVARAATPTQIADGVRVLTKKAQELQAPAQSINIINAPLIIIGQGPFPVIISGNTDIVSTATVLISQLDGTAPITEAQQCTLVFDSFREFVRINQAYLNIMIGKAGILTKVPLVGPPVASTFRQMENVYDTISITLINLCESRAKDLTSEANSLGNTLDLAIKQYEGLSI